MESGATSSAVPAPRLAATLAWGGILVVAAVFPQPEAVAANVSDTLLHAGAYGLFGLLLAWTLLPRRGAPGAGVAGVLGTVLLGTLTEALQSAVPWRSAELRDVVSDAAGAAVLVGLLLAVAALRGGAAP